MTSKALEAARKAMWSAINSSDTSDPAEACIRAFAQNLSDEAAEAASSVRYQKATAFLPDMNNDDHKRAVTRCIQAAIEKDLE